MNQLRRIWVWISRIHHSRGFGIQSPTDYGFVRYVVNEHWPYYAYETLAADDWLSGKLGRLYLRLANWRQPSAMRRDRYERWWLAGCKRIRMTNETERVELARVDVEEQQLLETVLSKADSRSVLVVEGIWRQPDAWRQVLRDGRVGVTFDLYYCGIVFFDLSRHKRNYTVNF